MNQKKVLIVDDEPDLVETIRFALETEALSVHVANDGEEGLKQARTESPDLIILDLMLPKMDGYKVCRLLKFDSRYANIPIIIFTAKAQGDDIKLGEEVGANAYLLKPFEPKVLLDKIKEL